MRVRFKIQRFDVQGTPPLLVPLVARIENWHAPFPHIDWD
jgi:hypothetical protein